MKMMATIVLFLAMHIARAQLVYILCETPFTVTNSQSSSSFKSVWIKFSSANQTAEIQLESGKKLLRNFKSIERPYYVIENEKVRYRPNMLVSKADTISIGNSNAAIKQVAATKVVQENPETQWPTILHGVATLQYEWEKTERIKEILAQQETTCAQQAELLKCLQFDASRVEIINKAKVNSDCILVLQNLVAEPYKIMIIKR